MTRRARLILPFALAWLADCAAPRSAPPRVAYSRNHAQQHYGDCAGADGCTQIELRWPEITAAPTALARESLTAFVRDALLRPYEGGAPLPSPDSVMAQFIEAYHTSASEYPTGGAIPWRFERRIEVLGDTLGVASLAVSETAFTGGAHPNSMVRFTTFDARTGRMLRRDDLLRAEDRDSLDAAGERAFRRLRRLPAGRDLGEAGFMFKDGRFHLNENMAVTPDGLLFYFNEYEVGAHALGATELALPWSEVKPFLRRDGPLGRP